MNYFKRIFLAIAAMMAFALITGDALVPPFFNAVTAATHPPDIPTDSVINLQAEIIYCEEMDFEGEWTPYEDVTLTWEPTSDGSETGYEIWATTTTGVFEKIDTVTANTTEYTDYFIEMNYSDVEVIEYKVRPMFDNKPGTFCEPIKVNNPGYGRY